MDNNQWIDLSLLPKITMKNGKQRINWDQSIGKSLPFFYNGEFGNVIIIKSINSRSVEVSIQTKDKIKTGTILKQNFTKCMFGNLLRDKIVDTAPWMIEYMCNKKDAKKYSKQSNQYIKAKCPNCGYIKDISISNLYQYGFSCPNCSDGISYPNKFMFNLLRQLNIRFKNEITKKDKGFDWIGNYRYDFYFENNNKKYFVEMDGGYHIYDDVKIIDEIKDRLAQEHGINIIRINCMYHSLNRLNYIKENILLSELPKVLNFNENDVDWAKCHSYGISSLVIQTCKLWNNGVRNVNKISQIMSLSRLTIKRYLKECSENGMCDYDANYRKKHVTCNREINVYKQNKFCGTFISFKELSEKSESLFGVYFVKSIISDCCHNKRLSYKGYTFVFADEDNNTKLLKEVC